MRETLTRALVTALEPGDEAALVMRVFAIPLLIVTGGRGLAVVHGVVPDVGELQKLFEKHGALGQSKNFGLSNALRRFRARVGDPDATVASYSDGSVRINLRSPFDASLACEYRWPLYPEDDLGAVGSSIFGLLAECRLETVQVAETVWLAKVSSH